MTLDEFYAEIQKREGVTILSLISPWQAPTSELIVASIAQAFRARNLSAIRVPIRPNSTNQSIGNQVGEFVVSELNRSLDGLQILNCSGAGYPDKVLEDLRSGQRYPFELKATSQWNEADSNRRVLTSSSRKLREKFRPPIQHILATSLYRQTETGYFITAIRLDFLEPSTEVNVRLEASVNHKILSEGAHRNTVIDT